MVALELKTIIMEAIIQHIIDTWIVWVTGFSALIYYEVNEKYSVWDKFINWINGKIYADEEM